MGIQINGITDDISAVDGGLTISDLEINQSGISTFNAGLDCNGDLDVDGHTELDNVNIAGIVTTTQFKVTTGANAFETSSNVFKGASGQKGVYLRSALSSATTPSYSSVDDTNTGIFLPGSDVFAVTTGGTEKLRIDSNGDMALGGSPITSGYTSFTIHESGTASGDHVRFNMTNGNTGNTASDGFSITVNGSTKNTHLIQRETADMVFQTNGGERLRINDNGHLGLNITPGSWDNTFKALEGGGSNKHGELFFQANGDWTTALGCNLYFNSGWKYRHTGAANWLEMKEDRTTFYMADSGSADSAITWLERLRIHSTGYITKPYQVAFFAHCSFGNHDLSGGDKFQFNVLTSSGKAAVNSNHHTFGGTAVFNTSTNTFTAPVAGLYSFTVGAYFRRTGDPLTHLVPRVNNSEVSNGNNNIFFFGSNDITDGDQLCGTVYLQLAANDAVTIHRRSTQTGTTRFYGPHSHFCGHLIG